MSKGERGAGAGETRLPKDLEPLAEVNVFRRQKTIIDRRACRAVGPDAQYSWASHYRPPARHGC